MPKADAPKLTPAMQQFHRFKKQHPGCVLFFRMGDFYEMFHDDAELAHRVLGVTLTQRTEGVPMAGVPYHAVEGYLRRMIQAGYRVAVCDQVEDATQAKGIVKRDVTRVVTPGTLTDESLLADEQVNTLTAIAFHDDDAVSAAWAELSTGTLSVGTWSPDTLIDELARVRPTELLFCETATGDVPPRVQRVIEALDCAATGRPAWQFRQAEAVDVLKQQYGVAQLGGFGFADDDPGLSAAGAVVAYLIETQRTSAAGDDEARLNHLQPPRRYTRDDHLLIDQTSLRSLEVEQTLRTGGADHSLIGTLRSGGACVTAMGKRLLRQWLCYPLRDREAIERRQRIVEALVNDSRFRDELRDVLDKVHDVPRIIGRLGVGRAMPRDLTALGRSTGQAHAAAELLAQRPAVTDFHRRLASLADPLSELATMIETACVDAPPAHLREGGLIRDGHDTRLDEYRTLQRDSHAWLARYQKQLVEQSQIPSLKVGYNKVFGYYIEVSAANKDKVKDEDEVFRGWARKQTLKNAERYVTPELKEFEGKVLSADSRAIEREQELFAALCAAAAEKTATLQVFAEALAELDVLQAFARRAVKHRYVKPTITDEPVLTIEGGRHPVLDELLGDGFVPNDVELGVRVPGSGARAHDVTEPEPGTPNPEPTPGASLALITGPNMAGKSTYIRQTALIALLAHTGCFVPANRAVVGLCDRIFTRVGANDELHAGQSTFMVEMTETANICHHATSASLVILDEIGRGTSTLDGLSLAWAIAEFLAERKPRCLFATHYHELTTLAERYPNVTNLNVTVREWQDQIVFLHRIAPGATNRSYGIHVAKIAGLPDGVVQRANALLSELAVNHEGGAPPPAAPKNTNGAGQLPLFTEYVPHPALDELRRIEIEAMSPLQAFDLLRRLREQVDDFVRKD